MQYDNFSDVYLPQGGAPAVCYRSGLTVYEEFLDGGVLCSGGWNTAGYPLNVLSACPSRFSRGDFRRPCVFGITANGVRLDSGWLWEGCTVSSEEKPGAPRVCCLKAPSCPSASPLSPVLTAPAFSPDSWKLKIRERLPLTSPSFPLCRAARK